MPTWFRAAAVIAALSFASLTLLLTSCGEEECWPNCDGLICGSDGCGGSCGSCEEGMVCDFGACVPSCDGGLAYCDGYCVDLSTDRNHCGRCDNPCPMGETCTLGECESTSCTPNCAGKECGDDGCGGSCGICDVGYSCQAGTCIEDSCLPDCVGKECGGDGCGGSCGSCNAGSTCVGGECIVDQPGDEAVLVAWEWGCEPGGSAPPTTANAANTGSRLTAYGVRETASSHEYHTFVCVSDAYSTKHWNNADYTEKYWMVRFSTAGYEEIRISSKQSGSNTGPRDFIVQYGTDGSSWTGTGVTVSAGTDWEAGVVSRHLLPASLDDRQDVYVRWLLSGDVSINGGTIGTTGAGRINEIVIEAKPR